MNFWIRTSRVGKVGVMMYVTRSGVHVEVGCQTAQIARTDFETFVQGPQRQPSGTDRLRRNNTVERVVVGMETPSCSGDVTYWTGTKHATDNC